MRDERQGDTVRDVDVLLEEKEPPEELNLQELFEGKEGCALIEALEVVSQSGNKRRVWIVMSEQAALPDNHHVKNTA